MNMLQDAVETKKTILILDDDPRVPDILGRLLDRHGFRVVGAGGSQEAMRQVEELNTSIDVMILDVQLDGSPMNGLELGLMVKERLRERPPEFLVYTAFPESRYYQMAIHLGAASFLVKPSSNEELLLMVRALALRRALTPGRPEVMRQIDRLVGGGHGASDAVRLLCREIVRPEIAATLNRPFLLLLNDHGPTVNLGDGLDLPEHCKAYDWLQQLTHLHSPSQPLVVKPSYLPEGLPADDRREVQDVFQRLEGAVFIPLANDGALRISLGLVEEPPTPSRLREDPFLLCQAIGSRVQPTFFRSLKELAEWWMRANTEHQALEAAASFCLFFGQEVVDRLDAAQRRGHLGDLTAGVIPPEIEDLAVLGENMSHAGTVLSVITSRRGETEAASPNILVEMASLVEKAWCEVAATFELADPDLLSLRGTCDVAGHKDNLQVAVAGILRWMALRIEATPAGTAAKVAVECRSLGREAQVDFKDRSRRLPRELRQGLFSFFGDTGAEAATRKGRHQEMLGLYLSRVLVESDHGTIEDHSDVASDGVGHHFLVRLPLAEAGASSP